METYTKLWLTTHYVKDYEFSIHLRMIAALAFVPPFDVENAFEELAFEIRNRFNIEADNVLDYFEDTYIVQIPTKCTTRDEKNEIYIFS